MIARTLCLALLLTGPALLRAADEEAPRTHMKELMRARIAEDAKKVSEQKKDAPATAPKATPAGTAAEPAKTDPTAATKADEKTAAGEKKDKPAKEPAPTQVMPKVEVRKGRITELDMQIAKQEQDIEREKKNLKTSEVDSALNDAKIARPLSIFGGDSTQFRTHVASERVELMEAEKDILEAMKFAKTADEKAALQKQLDDLRNYRRELDKALR